MRSWGRRTWMRVVVLGLVGAALTAVVIGPAAGATTGHGTSHALLTRCARQVFGLGGPGARPAPGSADPQLVAELGVLRQAHTPLPTVARLGVTLAGAGVRTYDPSATVRLRRIDGSGRAYAIPATLAAPRLPARCAHLPQLAGVGGYLALRALQAGTGPGVCVVGVQREPTVPTGVQLPGRPQPKRTQLAIGVLTCESATNLTGYMGAFGPVVPSAGAAQRVLVPDGITTLTYTLADGRAFTTHVIGNLAKLPTGLTAHAGQRLPAHGLGHMLAARLPTTVTETGPAVNPPVTLTRPPALIPDTVKSVAFLKKLVTLSGTGSSSDSSAQVSCSARTHRCVAVIITTRCPTQRRCVTTRTIKRYRYVGSRPPRGTVHQVLPTGPILARVNRVVTRPRKLSLMLSGTPRRHVTVIETVSCWSRRIASAGGGPPTMRLAVPSRTHIELPGRHWRSCDVSALVIGPRTGAVHARVVRG